MSTAQSNALMDNKLRLVAPPHEKAVIKYDRPQQPTLSLRFKDNQPRFIVYTNVDGDKDNGRIEAAMDCYTLSLVFETVIEMADRPDAEPVFIECKNFIYPGGKRSDAPVVVAKIVVAWDRNTGYLSLSVVSYDKSRPVIIFPIVPTEYHNVCDRAGNVVDTKTTSRLFAKGWAKWMSAIATQISVKEHMSADEIKARKEANQQNRGGGNRSGGGGWNKPQGGQQNRGNGNSGGGYNQRPAAVAADDVDDDIPW